ncbi:MAG: R3H domain-containing nucleic acid-binding protein [Caldisericia bacterium]
MKQQEAKVRDFLYEMLPKLFGYMDEEIGVKIHRDYDTLFCSLEMENSAIFIGKSGECLAAIQYLVNMILQENDFNLVRITIDIGGYKRRQIEILRNIAQNAAIKVKRYNRPVELQPMSAFARRIIHTALKDNPAVVTHSIDDEPRRRVIVDIRK